MPKMTRREVLHTGVETVAILPVFDLMAYSGAVPAVSSSGPTQLDTRTFVNTSGSTQASGFVSPIFGQWFKQGDVPAGTVPQFLVRGTPQPFSWGCQTYYADGSLCFAIFMLRCTSSIAGSSTLAVSVCNGGTAPSASSRTLTEVYAAAIQVNGTGLGSATGLSGTWSAYVRNDTNNHAQSVYLDGQAGKVWRIETEWAQNAGGTAHGQLYCYHYIAALQNGSGNLGGFRYLARVMQPWYNNDTPAKAPRLFTTLNWQQGAGPTTTNFLFPGTSRTFTTAAGTLATATSPFDWYNGGTQAGNLVPGYVTVTGGAMDTALAANTIYWASIDHSSNTLFNIFARPTVTASNSLSLNGNATGTMTFNIAPVCLHFGTIFNATVDGQWNFFQGAGSFPADCTVRTTYSTTYLLSTGLLPPVNTGQPTPTDLNATWAASYNWNICSWGTLNAGIGHPGSDQGIGLITGYQTIHIFNQSKGGEKAIRAEALAGAFGAYSLRDVSTRQLLNMGAGTYAGLPAPNSNQQNTLFWSGNPGNVRGFTAPPSNNSNFAWGENDMSHYPSFVYYAYLIFGNPEYLDLLMELANAPMQGSLHRTPSVPTAASAIISAFGGSISVRGAAWGNRNLQQAAALAPLNYPDGSQLSNYIVDTADANADWPVTMMTAALTNDWYANQAQTWGSFEVANTLDFQSGGLSFMMQYYTIVMCYAASNRRQRSAAASWLTKRAVALNHYATIFGQWHFYYEDDRAWIDSAPSCGNFLPGITDDTMYGIGTAGPVITISWNSGASPKFSMNGPRYGYVPASGDALIFDPCERVIPASIATNQTYFLRDVGAPSGGNYRFNIALAPTGAPDWSATHAYACRTFVQPLTGNAGSFVYAAIIAGTSASSHPTWPQSAGSTVTDGGVTWKCLGTTAVVSPSDTNSVPGGGSGLGPWFISSKPPNAASGEVANGNVSNDSYLTYHMAAAAYMQHLGYNTSAIYTDARTRSNVNAIDYRNNPQWNWIP